MAIEPCSSVEYKSCSTSSNLIEAFLSRLSHVYQNGTNIRAFITAFLQQHEILEQNICQLLDNFNIDTAVGNQLDIVGLYVGLPRNICNVYRQLFFGFIKPNDDCCTDFNVGLCDGEFYCGNTSQRFRDYTFVDDAEYRKYIKAIIYSQNFDGTLKQYERIVQYVFDDIDFNNVNSVGTTRVLTHGGGMILIAVTADLTLQQKRLIELNKYVLPYYGTTRVKVIVGDDYFKLDKHSTLTGLCTKFKGVY